MREQKSMLCMQIVSFKTYATILPSTDLWKPNDLIYNMFIIIYHYSLHLSQ
jgi:hypothetical protein